MSDNDANHEIDTVVAAGDYYLARDYAEDHPGDLARALFTRALLTGTLAVACGAAIPRGRAEISDEGMDTLRAAVKTSRNATWARYLAMSDPGADIGALSRMAADNASAEEAILFALYIPGADMDSLRARVDLVGTRAQLADFDRIIARYA